MLGNVDKNSSLAVGVDKVNNNEAVHLGICTRKVEGQLVESVVLALP